MKLLSAFLADLLFQRKQINFNLAKDTAPKFTYATRFLTLTFAN